MKKYNYLILTNIFVLAIFLSACTSYSDDMPHFTVEKEDTDNPEEPEEPEDPWDDPNLIFYDDFEGTTYDRKNWDLAVKSNANWAWFLSPNPAGIVVADGNLYLRAQWDNSGGGNPITWGVTTKDRFSFDYGEIQVRAKFTKTGKGAWPAIWLMPQTPLFPDWPECGEIDIMERVDDASVIYHAFHIKGKSGEKIVSNDIVDFSDYNVYSLKKRYDSIEFYVNGKNTYTLKRSDISQNVWPFDTDWYIILNHACSDDGDWGLKWWPQLVTDPSKLPYEMAVDWVKVYKF